MKKVAVTGNLACGKTTVCQLLKEFGAFTLSSDEIIHGLYSPKTLLGQKISALLGADVVLQGSFDRKKIAEKVFGNPDLLRKLEQLLHPEVQKIIENKYSEMIANKQLFPLFVVEIPLLFESGYDKFYDVTLAVVADVNISSQRYVEAKQATSEDFFARWNEMMPQDEKAARADIVVTNNGSKEDLKKAVEIIFKRLNKL